MSREEWYAFVFSNFKILPADLADMTYEQQYILTKSLSTPTKEKLFSSMSEYLLWKNKKDG